MRRQNARKVGMEKMEKVNLAYRRKDDTIEGILLVKSADLRISGTGAKYLDMTVMDETGEMNAKAWNWNDGPVPAANCAAFIKGIVGEFNGRPQMRVDRIRAAREIEIEWEALVPTAPIKAQEMFQEVARVAMSLERDEFKRLTVALLQEKKEQLMIWPAAVSFHHAQRSGLLYHTLTMLRAAQALLPVYPHLDRSLLLCGVIAHDLSKIEELNAEQLGIASEYTRQGNLVGHIVAGAAHIEVLCKQLEISEETSMLIQHMILSHHELPEYGSPKAPMFPEAQMLHVLDLMDARMFAMQEALAPVAPGDFSERVRALDGRKLYKPKLD